MEIRFLEGWKECKLPGLFYGVDLVPCGELEENLRDKWTFFEVTKEYDVKMKTDNVKGVGV